MATFINAQTGVALDPMLAEAFMGPKGLFSLGKERTFTGGILGQAIPLATATAQKVFELAFLCTSTTGEEQLAIRSFFRGDGDFIMLDEERLITEPLRFSVVAIDEDFFSGADTLTITAQARYGDLVKETRQVGWTGTVPPGASFAGTTATLQNTTGSEATLLVVLEAETPDAIWAPDVEVKVTTTLGRTLMATIGQNGPYGQLASWKGKRLEIDSDTQVLEGYANISPFYAGFFKLPPNAIIGVNLLGFQNPLISAQNTQISLILRSVALQEAF